MYIAEEGSDALRNDEELLEKDKEYLEESLKTDKIAKYKFDLVDKSNTTNQTGKIIFKGLPNPSPKNINLEEENGKKIVTSPMYVYI